MCHCSLPVPHLKLPASQVIALQASENPAMMAVVSQLQHAVLTMPWEVRIAAAQAIAKVRRSLWQLLQPNIRCCTSSNYYSVHNLAYACSGGGAVGGAIPDTLLQHPALASSIRPSGWQ